MPPKQQKINPLTVTREEFLDAAAAADIDMLCEKFIVGTFLGIAPVNAREIAYRCAGNASSTLRECSRSLTEEFFRFVEIIKSGKGVPTAVFADKDTPREYSFIPLEQYSANLVTYDSYGKLIDSYFIQRATAERVKRRASDVSRIIQNAEKRISKKLQILTSELESCEEGEKYRLWGDLITANIYRLKRGQDSCILENYYGETEEVKIPLDKRLTPAQNAQKYYKKYSKSKSAKEHLAVQIKLAREEGDYMATVADSLSRAETEKEISEIRSELYHSGYASKMKNYSEKKKITPSFMKYKTSGGYTLLCGRNNLANDYITFKVSEKSDWWFHVKGMPGSHVLMQCPKGVEPSELDFTEACMVAAVNSKAADSAAVDVDYTPVKHVKKISASKPGHVLYHTNYSARVTPDREIVNSLLVK